MKSSRKLWAREKAPNQLKVVTKIAIRNPTEATGDRGKRSSLYTTEKAAWN